MTNTKMFRKHVDKLGLKYIFIANELNLTPYGLSNKIDNKTEFKASEITKLSKILNLTDKQVNLIFFA